MYCAQVVETATMILRRRSDTPTHATARRTRTDRSHPQAGSCQTAKDDGGKPGVRFLARSKRGTRFRTASLLGGTRQRRRSKVEDPAEQAELAKEAATGRLKRDELKERTSTPRKSRGVGKTRKITSRVFRTSAGPRITVELKRGLDGPTALAAVEEVARQLRDELGIGDQAAA